MILGSVATEPHPMRKSTDRATMADSVATPIADSVPVEAEDATFTPLAEPVPTAPPDLRAAATSSLALRLSPKYLEEHCLLPLGIDRAGSIVLAVSEPPDPSVVDELSWLYRRPIRLVDAPAAEIQTAVLSAQREAPTSLRATDARGVDLELLGPEDDALDDLRALANQAPVIKMVNVMILEALRARASDVHLESTPDGLRIRYRIDGILQEVQRPPHQYQAAVISRLRSWRASTSPSDVWHRMAVYVFDFLIVSSTSGSRSRLRCMGRA